MKESFEIPLDDCALSEIREGNRVTYQTKAPDGTILSVTTDDAVTVDVLTISKYLGAKVKVIIDIDHDKAAYKGVTPE